MKKVLASKDLVQNISKRAKEGVVIVLRDLVKCRRGKSLPVSQINLFHLYFYQDFLLKIVKTLDNVMMCQVSFRCNT